MLGFDHVVDNVGAGGVAAGVAEPLLADVALDDAGGVVVAAVPARALGQGVRRLRAGVVAAGRGRAAAAVVMPAHALGPLIVVVVFEPHVLDGRVEVSHRVSDGPSATRPPAAATTGWVTKRQPLL